VLQRRHTWQLLLLQVARILGPLLLQLLKGSR
jgi:hypothetical protein